MEDILEFKVFIADVDFHFTDSVINDFIYFIESKSIYWGGGYDKDYVQGSLYSKKVNIIDKDILAVEVGDFFKKLNAKIEVEIKFPSIFKIELDYQQCYCCGYFTIEERGNYEICNVCFWEDDGCFDLKKISHPNHMTLEEGRGNFIKIGACEERFVKNVVKNPEYMYRKGNL